MNDSRICNLLAVAALTFSVGWVVAWLGGWIVDSGIWPARAGLLAAGLSVAAAVTFLLSWQLKVSNRAAQKYVDALCRQYNLQSGELGTGSTASLPVGSDWTETAQRIRDTMEEYRRNVQDMEHDHVAMVIRGRRATAEVQRIKDILSGLPEPIIVVDDYEELLLANRSAEQLFGFKADNPQNRALGQLIKCERLVELLTNTASHKQKGSRTDEIEVGEEDGNPRWFRVTASGLPGSAENSNTENGNTGNGNTGKGNTENGETTPAEGFAAGSTASGGTLAVLRDIGDQKALQKRNAEFVSAVSHEMKTPLAGIKAYVELLADGDAEDEKTQEEFLGVIDSQADRLQRLVDNMLNLARIEAGVVNVSKQTRPLNEILEEALSVVQPSADAKQIELVSGLSPMYLGVLADRDMLLQSAINLLSNAIKYTAEKGTVTLRSRMLDNQVMFEVEDTGVGLSEEDCQRVFEKFYRVKKDKTMAVGTGLGLPLAKHIVEDVHGGQLVVNSTQGEGSTFSVIIPGAGQMS